MDPQVRHRREAQRDLPLLVWEFDQPCATVSSGPLGGGLGVRDWVLNATVPTGYGRLDPDVHLAQLGLDLGLVGDGVGLMTAVDVRRVVSHVDTGVVAHATVGIGAPGHAAAPTDPAAHHEEGSRPAPGTINIVATVPVRLSDAAMVNAVATITEAKVQALHELGVAGTGTPTDAICCVSATEGPVEPFAGPRSLWGARLARAVHAAVLAGGRDWLAHGEFPPACRESFPAS